MSSLRQYLIEEFMEDYEQGMMSRREALRHIAAIVGSVALASSILAACTPPAHPAAQQDPSPSAISTPITESTMEARQVEFAGQGATIKAYLTKPVGPGPFPAVLVCHENQGLTEHIKDVTRRLGNAGYVGLAGDLLSREGGTESIADRARISGVLGNAALVGRFVQDFQDGMRYLQSQLFV